MKSLARALAATLLALLAPTLLGARTPYDRPENDPTMTDAKKSLVVYFSRAGENYGVGTVEKGNTRLVAERIARETGADLFEILPREAYPERYDACIEAARREKEAGARPELAADIDIGGYDTIFVGYPNWWGDLPMGVYAFLESHDWSGKRIAPFCTHEGSGLSDTPGRIAATCAGATVTEGLALRGTTAQRDGEQTRRAVVRWLGKIGR